MSLTLENENFLFLIKLEFVMVENEALVTDIQELEVYAIEKESYFQEIIDIANEDVQQLEDSTAGYKDEMASMSAEIERKDFHLASAVSQIEVLAAYDETQKSIDKYGVSWKNRDLVVDKFKKTKSERNHMAEKVLHMKEKIPVVEMELERHVEMLERYRSKEFPPKDPTEETGALRVKLLKCKDQRKPFIEMKRSKETFMRKLDFQKREDDSIP